MKRSDIPKNYEPKNVEEKLYNFWMEKDYFHAVIDKNKKPYTIVMPPPNITGQLHMGHALDNTIQDILIRFKRIQGYSALWLQVPITPVLLPRQKLLRKCQKKV